MTATRQRLLATDLLVRIPAHRLFISIAQSSKVMCCVHLSARLCLLVCRARMHPALLTDLPHVTQPYVYVCPAAACAAVDRPAPPAPCLL